MLHTRAYRWRTTTLALFLFVIGYGPAPSGAEDSQDTLFVVGHGAFNGVDGALSCRAPGSGFGATTSITLPWPTYVSTGGPLHPAVGDLDGDVGDELAVGLGRGSNGWIAVFDDASTGHALLAWIQMPWVEYNLLNGTVYPAIGDLDGDGRGEIVAGLGAGGAGWFLILDDATTGFAAIGWRRIAWDTYANRADAETHVAVGDLEGDGKAEIVIGLGTGSAGWIETVGDADSGYAHETWQRLSWPDYNAINGTVFPAAGDIDGDGRAEIVAGLGVGGGGWLELIDDAAADFTTGRWVQLVWGDYNRTVGESHPAVGNLDDDAAAEIAVGVGPYSGDGGWFAIFDDLNAGAQHIAWRNMDSPAVKAAGAGTFPAIGAGRRVVVEPAVVTLTSPDGGEQWAAQSAHDITWTASSSVTAVTLDYSVDGGTTWQPIAASIDARAGRHAWTLPDVSSRNARVRIRDAGASTAVDVSAASFSIWRRTDDLVAAYAFDGNADDSSGNGFHASASNVAPATDRFGAAAGAYRFNGENSLVQANGLPALAGDFTIAFWQKSTQTRRMHAISLGTSASQNVDVSVNDASAAMVLFDTTGQQGWIVYGGAGTFTDGTWHHIVLMRTGTELALYVDGVKRGTTTATGPVGAEGVLRIGRGSYSEWWWDGVIDDVLIYRRALVDGEMAAIGAGRPSIAVLSPDGGEGWAAGSVHDITWAADAGTGPVDLELSTDGGATWAAIATSIGAASGSYTWKVPDISTRQASIRVRETAGARADVSDGAFSIVRLTDDLVASYLFDGDARDSSGNGFDGVPSNVQAASDRFNDEARAYHFNGADSVIEVTGLPAFDGDFAIAFWQKSSGLDRMIPLALGTTSTSHLDVAFDDGTGVIVFRDATGPNLAWIATGTLGEFTDGAWHHVVLMRAGSILRLYIDGVERGSTRSTGTIGSDGVLRIGRGSYNEWWWNGAIDDVLLYGRALADTEIAALFGARQALTLHSPNGGEYLAAGGTRTISWTADASVETVSIEFSADDGETWQEIAASVPAASGAYAWTVPALPTDRGRIRVREDGGGSDMSTAPFAIVIAEPGLIARYLFSASAFDSSGNGHDGVVTYATLARDRFGNDSSAYRFNGKSSRIEVAGIPALTGDFTISFWQHSTERYLMHALSFGSNSAAHLDVSFDELYGVLAYWNSSAPDANWIQGPSLDEVRDGGWHHILLMRRGAVIELRVDGILRGSVESTAAIAADGTLRLGRGSYDTWWWDGRLDDLAIYNRALEESEISSIAGDRPKVDILQPASGSTLVMGTAVGITWRASASVDTIRLEYSEDNGATWRTIASANAAAGEQSWTVAEGSSRIVLLRASDASTGIALSASHTLVVASGGASLWRQVTPAAPWGPRDGVGTLVFKGRIWMFGGWHPTDAFTYQEIWSSETGGDWRFEGYGPWSGTHACGCAVFDDKIWVVNGNGGADVWYSEDGRNWTLVTSAAPFGPRYKPYVVVHDNRLWLMGGVDVLSGSYRAYNDVWNTTDGLNWTRVTAKAPWTPRGIMHGAVSFAGKMWLLGGGVYKAPGSGATEEYFNEVWSSGDGVEWTRVTATAPWRPRLHHSVVVYADRMWVIAGHDQDGLMNDVWVSSDGATWTELAGSPWSARHAASAVVHRDALWLIAGYLVNDVWRLQLTGNLQIDEGAASTTSRPVTLRVTAPFAGVDMMQFSNDGVSWSESRPYAGVARWTLSSGYGSKTVYVRFRRSDGTWTTAFSDTISYNPQ